MIGSKIWPKTTPTNPIFCYKFLVIKFTILESYFSYIKPNFVFLKKFKLWPGLYFPLYHLLL
jgi:hypothetical protein